MDDPRLIELIAKFDKDQIIKLLLKHPDFIQDPFYKHFNKAIHKRVDELIELEKVHFI